MILKTRFNLGLVLVVGLLYHSLNAQSFKNYKQDLKGEPFTIDMVAIEGGAYKMGVEKGDKSRGDDEKPIHEVVVDDFWMGKYEITWEQYDAFVYGKFDMGQVESISKLTNLGIDAITGATTPYMDMSFGMGKGPNPAVNMTQYGAIMYCKWLTAKSGVFYRLPTEAEWEYVCKKGKNDEESNVMEIAWYEDNSDGKYQRTGTKKPNSLGIYDMLGNVSEWVLDQYDANYYSKSPKENPWNIPTKLYPRVVRGGSWKDTASKLCCTARHRSRSNWKVRDPQIPKSKWWHTEASFIGFRVVRPKVQPSPEEIKKYWLKAIVDYGLN